MIPGWFFMFPDPFFMVTGWFFMASCWFYVSRWGFMVFHGSRFIFRGSRWVFPWFFIVQGGLFMVFHNSRLVFHGSRLVYMVFQCSSLIYMVPGSFISELSGGGAKWWWWCSRCDLAVTDDYDDFYDEMIMMGEFVLQKCLIGGIKFRRMISLYITKCSRCQIRVA